jgi:hypothetical protein
MNFRFAVLLAGVTLGFTVMAQPAPDDQAPPPGQGGDQSDQADPPSRVARLSYLKGAVSFVPAGENDWVEAQMNRPLITGDKLWTDNGGRAELEIGSAAVRMDQQSSFDFLNLDDNAAQMELTQGAMNLRVRRLYDGQTYEIDTPTLAFVVNRVGEFRIDVQPDGQTTIVSVMHGGGDVYGEGGARFHVDEGQSVSFNDPQLQNYQSADLPQPDEFDQFALQRDARWDNAPSKRYVAEETIGYQDLDDYGTWANDVPEYGNVWYPSQVDVDWSPYHSGHWAWVGAYGWSWVDDAPWGFAPFHYGRWAYVGNRWGWCPGEIAVRPIYAPALVAFVGGGVAIGISSGPIGWFPLGYRDPYFPAYHVSQRYFTNVNIYNSRGLNVSLVGGYYGGYRGGHIDYAAIHYANRGVRGAVVAVPAATFVGARSVRGAAIRVDEHTFANGGRVSGFAAVAPTRASLVSSPAAHAVPAAAIRNRQIVAATRPPAPVASFATRQAVLAKNPGQPLAVHELHTASVGGAGGAAAAGRGANVHVVTQGGAPIHTTAAPAIKAHTVVGNPTGNPRVAGNSSLPAVQRGAANATTGRPAAVTGAQAQHFDSSRFAHPATTTGGAAATTNGQAQTIRPTNTIQNSHTTTNNNLRSNTTTNNNLKSNATTNGQTQTIRPTNTFQNSRTTTGGAAQTIKPTGQTQTIRPTNTIQNSTIQNSHTKGSGNEYHKGTPQTNTYHPATSTSQSAQTYHQPVQQVQPRAVTPQVQPHAPAPSRGGNNNDRGGNKDKDDDKKHGH